MKHLPAIPRPDPPPVAETLAVRSASNWPGLRARPSFSKATTMEITFVMCLMFQALVELGVFALIFEYA